MESMIVPSRSKRKVVRGTRGIYSYVEHMTARSIGLLVDQAMNCGLRRAVPTVPFTLLSDALELAFFRPRILSHGLYRGSRAAVHQGPAGVVCRDSENEALCQ